MAVKTKDILEGNILAQLIKLLLPVFFGYLCQQLYTTFNAIIVGQYVGKQALAAVGGSTSTLISLLVNFVIGLSAGITIITANYYARRQYDEIQKCVKTSFFISVVLGFCVTVLGIVFSRKTLMLMNVPEDVFEYSLIYMRIYFLGMIPNFMYNIGASILRAVGDMRRPTYFLAISCVSNILLGIIFVRIFNLGVVGVGLSTIISQTISAVLTMIAFYNSEDCYMYSLKDFGYDKDILKKTLKIGFPSGIQSVLYSITNVYLQATVNSFGTDTIAAYSAFGKIDEFYWNFESAIGVAIMTIVAQNYGAGKIDRVKKTARISLLLYIGITLLISGFDYVFAPTLISLFCDDTKVIEIGIEITRYVVMFWWMFGFIEAFSSTIKSVGHSLQTMIISGVCVCGTRIGYLLLFNYNTVEGALACYPISWAVTSIAFTIYYLSNKWIENEQIRN